MDELETLQRYALGNRDTEVLGGLLDLKSYKVIVDVRRKDETLQTSITDYYQNVK